MHATANRNMCFDSAGNVMLDCTDINDALCVEAECVCEPGYVLTTDHVYVGSSTKVSGAVRQCLRECILAATLCI
jgi:hypothetical protein